MSRHHDPYERGGGATGCLVGMGRAFFICALTITVLGLVGMGVILALSHYSDDALRDFSATLQNLGMGTADDMRLPVLWERLAVPVYTCASIALLSLVALFVIRTPKHTRRSLVEENA